MTQTNNVLNLEEICGASSEIEVEGEKIRLSPLTPEDFAQARRFFRDSQEDPIKVAADAIKEAPHLSDEVQSAMMVEAMQQRKTLGSFDTAAGREWSSSVDGISYFFWLSARKETKDLTHEKCFNMVSKLRAATLTMIMDRIDEVSGLKPEKKKGGKTPEPDQTSRQKKKAARKKKSRKKSP